MRQAALIARLAALTTLLALLFVPELFRGILEPLTENGAPAIYNQGSLLQLTLAHLALVAAATAIGGLAALAMGIFVTRPAGAEFLPLSRSIVNIGQTFPPVAVLALAVPAVGFGVTPTLIALVLYGLLPIFENTITGLREVPETTIEAARGMGMGGVAAPRPRRTAAGPAGRPGRPAPLGGRQSRHGDDRIDRRSQGPRRSDHRRAADRQHRVHPAGRRDRRPACRADL